MRLFISLIMVGSIGVASAANLVTNGSFEDGVIGNNTFLKVSAGGTDITGWTVFGNSVDQISGPTRWIAKDGNQMVDLGGTPGPGGVSQTLTTVVGQDYTVKFSLGENHEGSSGDDSVIFKFGGTSETLTGGVGNGNFVDFTRTITATSTSTVISFESLVTGSFGGTVDAVSVEAVPEPATLALLGLGALALRRKAKT